MAELWLSPYLIFPSMHRAGIGTSTFPIRLAPHRKPVAVASSGLIPQPLWMIQGDPNRLAATQISIQLSESIYPLLRRGARRK